MRTCSTGRNAIIVGAAVVGLLLGPALSAAADPGAGSLPADPGPVHQVAAGAGPRPAATGAVQRGNAARIRPAVTGRLAPSDLKIMNYYPADAGWSAMWTQYSHYRTDHDFADIAGLGANTVRVIVQPDAVGWPTVSAAGAAELKDIIDTADAHGLAVEITLFDLWYSYSDLAHSKTWAAQLLTPYQNDPRIALVELRNEIDTSSAPALSWAKAMMPYLATVLPGVPRTLSSTNTRSLETLGQAIPATDMDVVDIHLYGYIGTMPGELAAAKAMAGGRPVIVGEAGASTGEPGVRGSEQAQLTFYQQLTQFVADQGLAWFAPWTLTDFNPDAVPSAFRTPSEESYGLRRLDGSWKPAAQVVRDMFAGRNTFAFGGRELPAGKIYDDPGFEHENATASTSTDRFGAWKAFDTAAIGSITMKFGVGVNSSGAVEIADTGGSASAVPSVYQTFLLLSGPRTVSVSVRVRLVDATGFSRVAIAWFDGASYLGSVESPNADNRVGGWQRVFATGTAPATATSFQIHLKSAYNSGVAYFDCTALW